MRCSRAWSAVLLAGLFALVIGVSQAQTYSRTEVIEYHDDTTLWVLGQVKKTTCVSSIPADAACDGGTDSIVSQVDYGWKALPWKTYGFGKLQQTFSYDNTSSVASGQLGALKTVMDGNSNITALSNWKHGIPQSIKHPATLEVPAGATQSAVVDNNGWITSLTDETGSRTCYDYDAMGRIKKITYPSETQANVCNTSKWSETNIAFAPVASAEYGIAAGHWRQTVSTGNGRRITYFDALWRPLVTREYDTANETSTQRFQRFAYDHEGRTTFAAYPGATDALTKGAHTVYDALGRVTQVKRDWEGTGQLTTTTAYLSNADGYYTLVTNPRGQQTRTWYQAFDQPNYDMPTTIWHPAGAYTLITRDVFGKPTKIRRSSSSGPTGGTGIDRTYTYNVNQELCRAVEPETGATVMGYDGAGNLTWSASGLPASTACHATGNTTAINARKAVRTYDARNRLETLTFPDNRGNQTWTYTSDGLPATISTVQVGVTAPTLNEYAYNRRRLLTSEHQTPYARETWTLAHNYNANGHLSDTTYPSGLNVAYAPNALGQPTRAGTFATGVNYHPNGAIKQFTYGNGIVHTLTQNARGLPDTSCDFYGSCNASAVLNDGYDYDQNGNVAAISDGRTANRGNRTMAYDGLDRLTQAVSPMFGTATYVYDVLDNLTRVKVGATAMAAARDHFYCYDASWRLTNVKTGSCSGTTVMGLGYDVQGNLDNKNGATYEFDYGNRLRRIDGWRSYTYDGHGRREIETVGTTNPQRRRFMYGVDGRLVYESETSNSSTDSVHLGGSLVARRTRPIGSPNPSETINYQHTDALGSPVAVTNASRTVVERTEYEPYGQPGNRPARNGVGYTGHVEDTSGLVYMQQRYYDPMLAVFLSVDPVIAYEQPISQFHRYRYANNSPYKFTDPDGRQHKAVGLPPPGVLIPIPQQQRFRAAEDRAIVKTAYVRVNVGTASGGTPALSASGETASGTAAFSVINGLSFDSSGPSLGFNSFGEQASFGDSRAGSETMAGYSVELFGLTFGLSNLETASKIEALPLETASLGPASAGGGQGEAGWRLEVGTGARNRASYRIDPEEEARNIDK